MYRLDSVDVGVHRRWENIIRCVSKKRLNFKTV